MSRAREREDAAHRYADAGWHVFPAEPGGKRPATEHGFLDATTSHKQIQNWWRSEPRSNLAVATGAPGPDVLDVDKHKDGNGFGAFNQLKQAGLVRDPMAIVRTPSGGFHAYYKGTEHQRNGHIPGVYVDFRSQGGYVVAPPSTIAGRTYEVARKQPSADTFDWGAARQVLDPQPERQPYKAPERTGDCPRDLSHLPSWVASQPEGNRNHGLFWASCRAAEAGDTATLDGLASAARSAGLDEREIDRTIASAQRTAATTGAATRPIEHSQPPMAAAAVDQLHPQAGAEAGALPPRPASGPRHGAPPPNGSLIPIHCANGDPMPSNTTAEVQPAAAPGTAAPAPTVDQARAAWATVPRDAELDRWGELYALAVPRHEPEAGQ